jgi:hypothetical protein
MDRMKKALAKGGRNWKLYSDAAAYCADQEVQLSQGMAWAEQSIHLQENPTNLFVLARLQRELGRSEAALQSLQKAIRLAEARHEGQSVLGPLQQMLDAWKKQD